MLEYPDDLHGLPSDYPLAPEKVEISQNMLSIYCCNIANEYGIKIGGGNKLVPTKVIMFFIAEILSYICH